MKDVYCISYGKTNNTSNKINKLSGMKNYSFTSKETLIQQSASLNPIVVVVDTYQNESESLELAKKLKSIWSQTPIIFTTDFSSEKFMFQALMTGVDDFIGQQSDDIEFKNRFFARISFYSQQNQKSTEAISYADLTLNSITRELEGPDNKTYLSPTEVSIMKVLFLAEGSLVTREDIKRKCWGQVVVTNNALDRHIHGVRAAIKSLTHSIKMRSVYGKGYLLEETQQQSIAS
jgi:two-component system response regulator MprA